MSIRQEDKRSPCAAEAIPRFLTHLPDRLEQSAHYFARLPGGFATMPLSAGSSVPPVPNLPLSVVRRRQPGGENPLHASSISTPGRSLFGGLTSCVKTLTGTV